MISVKNISLNFGDRVLFNEISFQINPKDRIGLVGRNGAGKSTLLKLIVGEIQPDGGEVGMPSDITIGYLPQEINYTDKNNLLDETMTAFSELRHLEREIDELNTQLSERTDYESEEYLDLAERVAEKSERMHHVNAFTAEATAVKTLKGLGFGEEDMKRPTEEFSGGWRMRIELAKILLRSPDIFLLDEPTNHLDIESIQWMENFLRNYHGSVVVISHDRTFLNNVTNRTLEISLGKVYDYKVPYTEYKKLRAERREQQMLAYRNQQKQIADTESFIERFRYKATKAVQVQSRIKQLEKLDIIEIEDEDVSSMNIRFAGAQNSGKLPYKASGITKTYGSRLVLNNIDLVVERGEKIAFVGKNGEGKTTLSRILVGDLEYKGEMKPGYNVRTGYFAQNQDKLLDSGITVLETLDRVAVGDIRTRIRDILGAFLFRGDDVEKKVKVLSGGEKSRLALAKLLLEPYNVLILDEPTNHLDMRSKDILKMALQQFDGTLIVVSHDREFLDGLVNKIYEFKNHKIHEFRGGIFEFLEKRKIESLDALNKVQELKKSDPGKIDSDQKELYQKRKEFDKGIRKIESQIEELEKKIESSEKEAEKLAAIMSDGTVKKDDNIYDEYQQHKELAERLVLEWEKKHNLLESLKEERNSIF